MKTRDLLFELRTEELPPRTLSSLSKALEDGLVKGLDGAAVRHGSAQRFATPRRLAVRVDGCAEFAADRRIERRGPPVASSFDARGSATQAAAAFAKSCGVTVAELERLTTDKGEWLAYRGTESGAATITLLGAIVTAAVAALPIAKRMRWGDRSTEFVRPVRSVVLLFGAEVVPVEVLGFTSDRITAGHRFHAPRPLAVKTPKSYEGQLRRAKVIADFGRRRELIRAGVSEAASKSGGNALLDDRLLDEVTALVEWPVPVVGRFEQRFLTLPREVVIATVQDHQRYFAVQGADGRLTGEFVTVSNIESRDPAKVREGNERVVRPRLSDAAFFWDEDRKVSLDSLAAKLRGVVFQTKLGSYAEKAIRVRKLAEIIGERISAGPLVARAADLAKADLMSAMVGEFPELQGTMGRYYAAAQGEPADLAVALEEQYRPRFSGDAVPSGRLGQTLALADRLDTLAGIFAVDLKPTGTKDPFGLRRAALGVLRILLEGKLDLDLRDLVERASNDQPVTRPGVAREVWQFIEERLRGLLLERADGASADMIDAVLAGGARSPVEADARLAALKAFLLSPDAALLTAVNKRIVNILRKAPPGDVAAVQPAALVEPEERELYRVVSTLEGTVAGAVGAKRYGDAFALLRGVRASVDAFFERILVMDEDPVKRRNRLALLGCVQALLGSVADLSRLPG